MGAEGMQMTSEIRTLRTMLAAELADCIRLAELGDLAPLRAWAEIAKRLLLADVD